MIQEYDNKAIRVCIDKAFDAGYAEGTRKAAEWIRENILGYMDTDKNFEDCPIDIILSPYWEEDFNEYMNER